MIKKTEFLRTAHYKNALKIIDGLEQHGIEARLAGGCVRDRLMGHEPADYDVAVKATPEEFCKIFAQKNWKVIPTGLDHGTVTVLLNTTSVEVTALRTDVETYGRHAKVSFDDASFEQDAARRDFTINAMYEDKDGKVYDYFGGLKDIQKNVLRFVGDPKLRIQEDYLRILRFYRFWARFGSKADAAALKAIQALAPGLKQVSQERITLELLRMLSYNDIQGQLDSLRKTGILELLMPECAPFKKPQIDRCAKLNIQDPSLQPVARLAALLSPTLPKKETEKLSRRLKLSNLQMRIVLDLHCLFLPPSQLKLDQATIMAFIDSCEKNAGPGTFLSLFVPYWQTINNHNPKVKKLLNRCAKIEKQKHNLRIQPMPLSGTDVLAANPNLQSGPQLGEVLVKLKAAFRNEEWKTKAQGLRWIKKEIGSR